MTEDNKVPTNFLTKAKQLEALDVIGQSLEKLMQVSDPKDGLACMAMMLLLAGVHESIRAEMGAQTADEALDELARSLGL